MSNRLDWKTMRRTAAVTVLAWLSMLGFDLFLHAGLLASWYYEPSPFLLPPEQAFALIPLGYLGFLLLAVLLMWLATRLNIRGWSRGLRFGLTLGALIWGALALGLASISTADPRLLVGWFAGQTVEMGIAGMVVGSGLRGQNLGRLLLVVFGFILLAIAATIVLQNLGFAPAVKTTP